MRELKPQEPWRRPLRWLARGTILLVLAVCAARWGWGVYAQREWDRELQQYAAAGVPLSIETFAEPLISPEQNAVKDWEAVAEMIDADPRGRWLWDDAESRLPLDDEQMVLAAGLLRRLEPVWSRLDAAERKPGSQWSGGVTERPFQYGSDLSRAHRVTEFLEIAARHFHQRGDEAAAVRCVERMFALATAAARAPDGHRAFADVYASASFTLLQITPTLRVGDGSHELSEKRLREVIARLLDESAARPGMIRALEWRRMCVFEESAACARGAEIHLYPTTEILDSACKRWVLRPMVLTDTCLMLGQAEQAIVAAKLANDLPTFLALAPDAARLRVLRDELALKHMWAIACWPHYDEEVREHFEMLAGRRLAATALALRAYAASHSGTLPNRLDELVPAYLAHVPEDPMAAGRALSYRPSGPDPLLYSVGRDGNDDGGCDEFVDVRHAPDTESWFHMWRKRDAVVHLKGSMPQPNPLAAHRP